VQPTASRNAAIAGSVVSVIFVALVAATPGSPFLPVQPAGAQPSGPLRSLAGLVGLDSLHGNALAAAGVVSVAMAAVAFLFVLREAWRGTISLRAVIVLAVVYHVLLLALPLLFSRDVYSYAYYGRIAATHHANPYVSTPSDFPHDLLAPYIGPRWVETPAVYGPLFTLLSSLVVRVFTSVEGMVVAFRLIAVAASLGTIAVVGWLVHRVRPSREAFAVAILGLNPVVLFQSVGSGHNDLLVALSITGAIALVFARRELLATAVLALGTLVKATAAIPLLLLLVAVVARRDRGARGRTLLSHLAVAGGIGLAFSIPFLQRKDPSLGMIELAGHEGWLAPSRLFHRILDAMSGRTLGIAARVAFPLALLAGVFLIARWLARRGREVTPEAQGAAWGWGLLLLMLLGPVLLPWYVTWTLPVVWLLPRVPRAVAIGTGTALTVSQWTAEPARFIHAYDANVLFGHYVLTPVVFALLVWLCVDLLRRVRRGAPLDDEPGDIPASADES
jgi:alpha-1,6-mannosyltransferase